MTSGALRLWVAMLMMSSVPQTAAGPRPSPVRLAESVDLQRYAGQWFEIARLPNTPQAACVADVTARYSLRSDGAIDVINSCRTSAGLVTDTHGAGRKVGRGAPDAQLQVRYASGVRALFSGWTDYWILGIGPDYTWAVAGTPSRDRLWILSRTPEMSAASYERALAVARGNGFDVNRLVKTPQNAR
jgi:apolipoprotein D and lipocalin family protein